MQLEKINLPSSLPMLLIFKVSLAMVFSIMDLCPVRIAGRPIKFTLLSVMTISKGFESVTHYPGLRCGLYISLQQFTA